MEELVKHRVKLDSKSKRRTETSSSIPTTTSTSGQAVPEPLESAEPASTTPMDVSKFLADLASKYPHIIQDVNMFTNVSVTAPSLVPDMSSANTVDVGGREPLSQQCILAGIIPPPDAVRKSSKDNPPIATPIIIILLLLCACCGIMS